MANNKNKLVIIAGTVLVLALVGVTVLLLTEKQTNKILAEKSPTNSVMLPIIETTRKEPYQQAKKLLKFWPKNQSPTTQKNY